MNRSLLARWMVLAGLLSALLLVSGCWETTASYRCSWYLNTAYNCAQESYRHNCGNYTFYESNSECVATGCSEGGTGCVEHTD